MERGAMSRHKITLLPLTATLVLLIAASPLHASRLVGLSVIDKEYLMIHFQDGEVTFRDDGKGEDAFSSRTHIDGIDTVKKYGSPLDVSNATTVANWVITSDQDANYGAEGKNPVKCFRKSKLNGMAEKEWGNGDFNYEYTMEHFIYLQLPSSLVRGNGYTLAINASTNSDESSADITFDIFQCRSEALHVNLDRKSVV